MSVGVRSALVMLALACASLSTARAANAEELACDAGAPCADADGDGFGACNCANASAPCDCDDTNPTVFPGAPEACNATSDRTCNAVVDGCPAAQGCFEGTCVPRCVPLDDFGCVPGSRFFTEADGRCLCQPDDCSIFGCPPGETCDDAKRCVPTCSADVHCPFGQRCRGSGCVDPCEGITCPNGGSCLEGRCIASCACLPDSTGCAPGETCDRTQVVPQCVDSACAGIACAAAQHCERGVCVDDCAGVVCPPMRVCRVVDGDAGRRGACVDLCNPNPCAPAFACDWQTGTCSPKPIADGGIVEGVDEDAEAAALLVKGSGFGCTASTVGRASALTAAFGGVFALAMAVRRRRRR